MASQNPSWHILTEGYAVCDSGKFKRIKSCLVETWTAKGQFWSKEHNKNVLFVDFIRILMGFSTSLSPITHIKIYEKPIIIQKSLIFSLYLYYYYGVFHLQELLMIKPKNYQENPIIRDCSVSSELNDEIMTDTSEKRCWFLSAAQSSQCFLCRRKIPLALHWRVPQRRLAHPPNRFAWLKEIVLPIFSTENTLKNKS